MTASLTMNGPAVSKPEARRRTTVAVSLVFLILISCVFAAVLAYSRADRFRRAETGTLRDAVQVGRDLDLVFRSSNLILTSAKPFAAQILAKPAGTAPTPAELSTLTGLKAQWPFINDLYIVDSSEKLRLSASGSGKDLMLQRQYHDAAAAGALSGKATGLRDLDGSGAVLLVQPIGPADGQSVGALVATIDLSPITLPYRDIHRPLDLVLAVFRQDDLVPVVSAPPRFSAASSIVQDTAELRRALATSPSGTLSESSMADGSTQIMSYQKLDAAGLYIAVSVPRSVVRTFWRADLITLSALAALAAVALATVTFSVLHQMGVEQRAKDHLEMRVRERTTELETVNRHLETLFREVHHRVKNNLQIITSLLSLQAAKLSESPARDALQQSVNRVYSMSLVHDMLYTERDTTNIDCSAYLASLARRIGEAFETTDRISVEIIGDRLIVDLDVAIPLALISNEVVSNALKHAFPDGRSGRLIISVEKGPIETVLAISDDGVGYDWAEDHGSTDGVGLKILQALTQQLDGKVTFEERDGTRFVLRFPTDRRTDA